MEWIAGHHLFNILLQAFTAVGPCCTTSADVCCTAQMRLGCYTAAHQHVALPLLNLQVKAAAEQVTASAVAAPSGYKFDASSGYFHSPESGMYWDSKTGGFFNSADSKWYVYDVQAKEFRLWEQL